MSVFTNPAGQSIENAREYVSAILGLLGDRDPFEVLHATPAALQRTLDERTPEEICTAVVDAMLPARPSDDVALLVARTRRLDPERIADWDVSPDPAEVSRVRNACARKLAS